MPDRQPGHREHMQPGEDDLTTAEGVEEGSADSTAEAQRATGDVLGSTADGPNGADRSPAPPVDMESAQAREAREAAGTGQQLATGEG